MKWHAWRLIGLISAASAAAGEVQQRKDPQSGWTMYTATQGSTSVTVVPQAGCNTQSIRYGERDLLKSPESLKDLPGFRYGSPIMYPMPNRVRNSVFTFGGRSYRFEPNERTHFLHGLVHSVPWELTAIERKPDQVTIHCQLAFEPGTPPFERFGHRHVLKLGVRVTEAAVRYTYAVDNRRGDRPIPYGFGLHPWFRYQGQRANTYLTVPATHWMEAEGLLPTGRLVDLAGTKFDARQPTSLEGFVLDDVYFGLTADQPAVIDFREAKLRITLSASDEFTHLVVYTPAEQPWFCVENQTCSTDAHNLYAKGLRKESHLLIVEPGDTHTGWIEYRFDSL